MISAVLLNVLCTIILVSMDNIMGLTTMKLEQ